MMAGTGHTIVSFRLFCYDPAFQDKFSMAVTLLDVARYQEPSLFMLQKFKATLNTLDSRRSAVIIALLANRPWDDIKSLVDALPQPKAPNADGSYGGSTHAPRKPAPKWLPTSRTVKHKGTGGKKTINRKLWRSATDASVLAVKRIVKAADGSKKVRFQRV